ncbi:hypothetical protein [Nostoc sp. CCY 9925]
MISDAKMNAIAKIRRWLCQSQPRRKLEKAQKDFDIKEWTQ